MQKIFQIVKYEHKICFAEAKGYTINSSLNLRICSRLMRNSSHLMYMNGKWDSTNYCCFMRRLVVFNWVNKLFYSMHKRQIVFVS